MAKILLSIGLEGIPSIILLVFFLPIMIQAQEIEQIENLNNKEESIWIENEQASRISADGFSDDGAMAYINGIYTNNKNNLAKVFHINISDPGNYFLSAFALGYNTPSDEGNVYLTPIRIKIDGNPVGELDLQENG